MKLTAIFLTVTCLQLSAAGFSQSISLSAKDASLEKVLSTIERQSGYFFFYKYNEIRQAKPVTVSLNNVSVDQALEQSFKGQPFDYVIDNKTIVITRKPDNAVAAAAVLAEVKGHVTDNKGNPLPGATVRVKGGNQASVTDINGDFVFRNISENAVLIVSYTGFATREVAVSGQNSLTISLKEDNQDLNEVVVIGYGAVKKQDLSAAVSTVPDLDKAKSRPVLNVESMIQGKVPGVTVVNNGGHPDKTPTLVIRGTGSKSGESALVVVDGVPGAPYNPADVESVTVLKDAASAAIYGAFAGAAGVVLITTRQATKGKPSIEYNAFTGMKNAWRLPQSLTAADQAKVANLAAQNAGLSSPDGWDATKNPYAQVTRTDWINEIFRTGIVQRHNINLNGGTDQFKTLFQGRYEKEEGTLLNTFNQNMSLRFNTSYQLNKYIKLSENLFWNNNSKRGTETESGYTGTILSAIYMPRSATPYYDDGTFGGVGPRDSQYLGIFGDVVNPVATLLRNQDFNKTSDLQSVTELGVSDIVKGLSFLSRYSYRLGNNFYKNFQPKRLEPGKPILENYLNYSTIRSYQWLWENTLNYSRMFNRHSINAMVSMTDQEEGNRSFNVTGKGFENEAAWAQYFENASAWGDPNPVGDNDGDLKDRNVSYVGRLSYSWADRYFLTGNYRFDIAGRLPAGHRVKKAPGLTAAWKISSEPFFNLENVDLLKIRGSWGKLGNIFSVPPYYGYATLASDITYQIGNGATPTNALYMSEVKNRSLNWATQRQTDIGLDLSLMKTKITFSVDYFDKLTYDLIQPQSVDWTATLGTGAPLINQGKISNKGFEVAAGWKANAGSVHYELNGNIATLKNRVTEIDGNPNSAWTDGSSWRGVLKPYKTVVGQPLYSYWLIKTDGLFQSDEQAAAYVKDGNRIQPDAKAGDLKFVDLNNDGKIDDQDRSYMGSAFPDLTYGLTANLNWKNFDMSMFWQGVSGVKLFHAFKESTLNAAEQGYNRWDKILDAWSPDNKGSNIPRVNAGDPNHNFQQPSDWFLENGDYLRLKNLQIGYTFKKMPWNSFLRVYVSGDNLLTFTKYTGMDPEVGGIGFDGGQYPLSRIYSLGLNVKF